MKSNEAVLENKDAEVSVLDLAEIIHQAQS